MRLSKEARIGILVASAILIFSTGFYFLKGINIFSGEKNYIAYFDDVQGLQPSSQVQIKGMSVGRVATISLNGSNKVKVVLAINKNTAIPYGSIVKLISTDLLGTKAISLQLSSNSAIAPDGSVLNSQVEDGIINALSVEITPLLRDMRHAVGTLDSVLLSVNDVLDKSTVQSLKNASSNLDVTMSNFTSLSARLNGETQQLHGIIQNTNSITSNLANNNEHINHILENTASISDKLNKAPIEQTIADLQTSVQQLRVALDKINGKDGSLGLLMNDANLYHNLNSSLNTLNELMADIEAHPTRYLNFTIFGRKTK
ncbi:MAG: MCE family protein [Bacteroidetes bacterium]|nr:MCE family protein [Bacteroidota bacterium]MBS1740554.1 MCE family protein [Bacteroidota bacterium]